MLDKLLAGRSAPERVVQIGTNRVEMKDDAQIAAAIADVERRLAIAEGQRVHTVNLTVDRFGGSRSC